MATYDDLREQFRQLNKKAQRIQHQTEMMRRRLPIARTALETVASGDDAPEILRIAREALKELNVSSVPPEKQCLFLVADNPTPPVDVTDLRRYRELPEKLVACREDIITRPRICYQGRRKRPFVTRQQMCASTARPFRIRGNELTATGH